MIDTIHIRINLIFDLIQGPDYIKRLLQILVVRFRGEENGNIKITGMYRNFIIEIFGENISIKGSLSKYYKGNNLEYLNQAEIKAALKSLSKELGFKVERGRLSRIDVADNLFLSSIPKAYMVKFVSMGNSYPQRNKTSVTFKKSRLEYTFYDKILEMRTKDPGNYQLFGLNKSDANVLRYEVKFQRQLANLFGVEKVKVVMLYSSSFLKKLAQEWYDGYKKISKERNQIMNEIAKLSDLKQIILSCGFRALGGLEKLLPLIEMARVLNSWSNMMAKRSRDFLKALNDSPHTSEDCEFMLELDHVIANSNIVKNYIYK